MQRLTPCKLKEIIKEEAQKLNEIGFDNLPDGWDEDSLQSFARSLTGKTKDDTEGFFTKCYERMKDEEGFDEDGAKRFCAALKDEYLGTTDWRGESTNRSGPKLTENALRKMIREEARRLSEDVGKVSSELRKALRNHRKTRNPGRRSSRFSIKGHSGALEVEIAPRLGDVYLNYYEDSAAMTFDARASISNPTEKDPAFDIGGAKEMGMAADVNTVSYTVDGRQMATEDYQGPSRTIDTLLRLTL